MLLLSRRSHPVPDSKSIVLLYSLGLHTHFEGAGTTYEMPLPIRTVLGLLAPRESFYMSVRPMPAADFQQILFCDRLFTVANEDVSSVGELQISRCSITELK